MKRKARTFVQARDAARQGWPWYGLANGVTTLPSREIDPKTAKKIRKSLGLDQEALAPNVSSEQGAKKMRAFVYRAEFEHGDPRGIVVSFPDVPEAITQGDDEVDARAMAEEALGLALLTYPERGRPLPRPKARGRDLVPVSVAPDVAAKLAVLEAFREAGITKSALGRRINKDEKEVRRILNPKHPTKLPALTATLRALGRRLVIGMEKADEAA